MPTDVPALRVMKTFAFGEEGGGRWLVIECEDQNQQRLTIRVPHTLEAEFFARFQGASSMASEKRGETTNKAIMNALNAESFSVGVTDDGKIGVRMKLSMGMTMDLLLSESSIQQFRDALTQLDEYKKSGGPQRAQ